MQAARGYPQRLALSACLRRRGGERAYSSGQRGQAQLTHPDHRSHATSCAVRRDYGARPCHRPLLRVWAARGAVRYRRVCHQLRRMASLVGVEVVINLVFSKLPVATITELRAGPLGIFLTVSSVLFLLGTLAFVVSLGVTRGVPRMPLTLYFLGALPIALRAFVPELALDLGLVVLAASDHLASGMAVGTREHHRRFSPGSGTTDRSELMRTSPPHVLCGGGFGLPRGQSLERPVPSLKKTPLPPRCRRLARGPFYPVRHDQARHRVVRPLRHPAPGRAASAA